MDCTAAERLIQRELDALVLGDDDRFGGPGRLTAPEGLTADQSAALEQHCASCVECASLRAELRSVDAALAETAVEKAPAWLPTAVMREIARPADVRRVEPVVTTTGAVLGTIAAATTLIRSGALSGVAGPVGRFAAVVNGWVDGLTTTATTSPGLEVIETFQPGGVVIGVVWGLVAIGVAFLAISALRLSKELSFGSRRVLSR